MQGPSDDLNDDPYDDPDDQEFDEDELTAELAGVAEALLMLPDDLLGWYERQDIARRVERRDWLLPRDQRWLLQIAQ